MEFEEEEEEQEPLSLLFFSQEREGETGRGGEHLYTLWTKLSETPNSSEKREESIKANTFPNNRASNT